MLDYLAVYLVDQKYDLKKLIEHIVTSRAYQSQAVAHQDESCGRGLRVSRARSSKRMTAEQFVDAIWMMTGHGAREAAAAR